MRHGSTLALVAWCWLTLADGPARAGSGPNAGLGPNSGTGWSLPDESRGLRVAPILLLSRPEVQAELRMKPDQVADAARVIADARDKAIQLRGRKDPAAVDLRRSVDEEQRNWLEAKLTEDQVGRLSEIDLQWEGVAAIATRPAVAEALALRADQKAALSQAVAERNAHRGRSVGRERDPAAAERSFTQQVWSNLTDGQRKRWERMLGRPFALAASAASRTAR